MILHFIKKSKLISLFISTAFLIGMGVLMSKTQAKKSSKNQSAAFDKMWKKADSLEMKGLTKSAFELVQLIFQKAKSEGNTTNYIRSSIMGLKLSSALDEELYLLHIAKLEDEVKLAKFPCQQLLYSILAESYWNYYQNHRYQIHQRSASTENVGKDIRTWDLSALKQQIRSYYDMSIAAENKLKHENLSTYDGIILKDESTQSLRPTLYDFLVQRAIEYYSSDELDEVKPADAFEFDQSNYFDLSERFSNYSIRTTDTLSHQFKAIRLYQKLEQFHQSDKTLQAIADIELLRLKYIYQRSSQLKKDSLYQEALGNCAKHYSGKTESAEFNFELANNYWEIAGQSRQDTALRKSLLKRSFGLCEQIIAEFPASGAAKSSRYLKQLMLEKALQISLDEVQIPEQPILGHLTYKNTRVIYFKLVEVPANAAFEIHRWMKPDSQKSLLKLTAIQQWSLKFPNAEDLTEHSIQFNIQPIQAGHYCLISSADENFSLTKNGLAFSPFWVSTISFISNRKGSGEYEGYILDRESGRPIPGLTIQTWKEQYNYKDRDYSYVKGISIKADEKGYFQLPFKEGDRNVYLEFIKSSKDRFLSNQGFYLYKNPEFNNEEVKTSCFFYTDRKIYRPGQVVYFKGIMIDQQGKQQNLSVNTKSDISFYDVNGQVIQTAKVVSNDYGSFHGNFTIPLGLVNGQMNISNGFGSTFISVEEYKRPKFYVQIESLNNAYQLGDSVLINGSAAEFSGIQLNDSRVNYRVIRKSFNPIWYGYKMLQYEENSMEIIHGSTRTDSFGKFKFSFKAIPGKTTVRQEERNFSYTILVDVIDINGETQSDQQTIHIGESSTLLKSEIPDRIEKGIPLQVAIQSYNLNGNQIISQGVFRIYKLGNPSRIYRERRWQQVDRSIISPEKFHQLFPKDEYMDEANWVYLPRQKLVFESTFKTDTAANSKGSLIAIESVKDWESGIYFWEATTRDKNGKEVKLSNNFVLFSSTDKKNPYLSANFFSLLTPQQEPGDTAKIVFGTSEKNVQVLLEIEGSSGIEKREWIDLSDELREFMLPINESHRGNISVRMTFVKSNRIYQNSALINVPYSNKELEIRLETQRKKLRPGNEEHWKFLVKSKSRSLRNSEFMATMYDASLDQFQANSWILNPFSYFTTNGGWESNHSFQLSSSSASGKDWNNYSEPYYKIYDRLNWFGFEGGSFIPYGREGIVYSAARDLGVGSLAGASDAANPKSMKMEAASLVESQSTGQNGMNNQRSGMQNEIITQSNQDKKSGKSRTNFNETAFFFPMVYSKENGEIELNFLVPDALTQWKFIGLAHQKDLSVGNMVAYFETQKELMTTMNLPRFFREGDEVTISAKVGNMTSAFTHGHVHLTIFDGKGKINLNEKIVQDESSKIFEVKANESQMISWKLKIPEGVDALLLKIKGENNTYTDGEEMLVPVLPNRTLVMESMPFSMQVGTSKDILFEKFIQQNGGSKSLKNHRLSLEICSNPVWYVIQSIPYLMQSNDETTDGLFARYYANSIAKFLLTSNPKIKSVFEKWKTEKDSVSHELVLSNLERNKELKAIQNQETPWVSEAKNESERNRRLVEYFDEHNQEKQLKELLLEISERQLPNGGWSWIPGMPDNEFITLQILSGLGHLKKVGAISSEGDTNETIKSAIRYLDQRMLERYKLLLKLDKEIIERQNLSSTDIHYLYSRSFFTEIPFEAGVEKPFNHYLSLSKKNWISQSRFLQGMLALIYHRYGDDDTAKDLLKSNEENSLYSKELGRSWKESWLGYSWYESPIELQAIMIEAYTELRWPNQLVEELKLWLIQNKKTNGWNSDKATSDACYALLMSGENWLDNEVQVTAELGGKRIKLSENEIDLGYFKHSWDATELSSDYGQLKIKSKATKTNSNQLFWGAMYWHYFDEFDQISKSSNALQINKQFYKTINTAKGPVLEILPENGKLKIGDKVKVRLMIQSDREMDYVFLKDLRGAGFAMKQALSFFHNQDGLNYYQTNKDASVHFYFDKIPKGVFMIEYDLIAEQEGDFNCGITTIQCLYSADFTSNTGGRKLSIYR